jgi:FtsZ-binding cell division protein ZapB
MEADVTGEAADLTGDVEMLATPLLALWDDRMRALLGYMSAVEFR